MLGAITALAAERPNILVILTDGHGYGDVSAFRAQADVRTPEHRGNRRRREAVGA